MKNSIPKIFVRLDTSIPFSNIVDEKVLLMNAFKKVKEVKQKSSRLIVLTNRHLFYFQDHTKKRIKRKCELTFQTRFQILRQLPIVTFSLIQAENILGVPIGIKFEKDGHKPIQLYNEDPEIIDQWKQILQQKINQKGFNFMFKPVRKLGKGSYGDVYLMRRIQDNKLVAVKTFFKSKLFFQERGKQSVLNQINITKELCHENVMKFYGVYESVTSIYIIVEYLQGGSLNNKLQKKVNFQPEQIKILMRSLLKGLDYLNSRRIIHRDIKPQNLLFRFNNHWEVVICDMGLSTCIDYKEHLYTRCGTAGFVAPEIINLTDQDSKKIKFNPISDVFSAGLIFHILLLGKSIFSNNQPDQLLKQNRACDFNLHSTEYSNLDPDAYHLLMKMLTTNPKNRISASQALKHRYLQIQQQTQKLMMTKSKKYLILEKKENQKTDKLKQSKILLYQNRTVNNPNHYYTFINKLVKAKQHSLSPSKRSRMCTK